LWAIVHFLTAVAVDVVNYGTAVAVNVVYYRTAVAVTTILLLKQAAWLTSQLRNAVPNVEMNVMEP